MILTKSIKDDLYYKNHSYLKSCVFCQTTIQISRIPKNKIDTVIIQINENLLGLDSCIRIAIFYDFEF